MTILRNTLVSSFYFVKLTDLEVDNLHLQSCIFVEHRRMIKVKNIYRGCRNAKRKEKIMKNDLLIREVKNSRLLNEKTMHMNDYINELLAFQKNLGRIALNLKEDESVRLDELATRIKLKAREKDVNGNPDFIKGLVSLKEVEKELSISMSGWRGENSIANALNYVSRPNVSTYRNLDVTDGVETSELDNVVLTNNGIIILEVKRTKKDATITEEGRLFFGDDQCYEKHPLGQKMERKRRLLKGMLEQQLQKRGIELDVNIDSYIVFSTPRDVRIYINDYYKQEKNCRQGKLRYIVDEYTSDVQYSEAELEILEMILSEMKSRQKGFEIQLDYQQIFDDFLTMIALIEAKSEPVGISQKEDATKVFLEMVAPYREVMTQLSEKTGGNKIAAGLITGITAVTILGGVAAGIAGSRLA